jgi:LuxR family quorum-sensing system transcriptional regulator CciR
MSAHWDAGQFLGAARQARDLAQLDALMAETSKDLGFDYFALVHHTDIEASDHLDLEADDVIDLLNYPPWWREMIAERNYAADDPVLIACQFTSSGFRWSDIARMMTLTTRQKEIFDGARAAGMGTGFTTPFHVPGECSGSCSFGMRLGRDFDDAKMPIAQFAGSVGFEAGRSIVGAARAKAKSKTPRLTARQLDCLVHIAGGKSDWHAGKLLGISDHTVHQHIEEAKRRYAVSTRLQLVVRALFDGQLTFKDIIH